MTDFTGDSLVELDRVIRWWRDEFNEWWLFFRRPHPLACRHCCGLTEASGKCVECNHTGAKPGTELWAAFAELARKRDAGERVHLLPGEWGGWRR